MNATFKVGQKVKVAGAAMGPRCSWMTLHGTVTDTEMGEEEYRYYVALDPRYHSGMKVRGLVALADEMTAV